MAVVHDYFCPDCGHVEENLIASEQCRKCEAKNEILGLGKVAPVLRVHFGRIRTLDDRGKKESMGYGKPNPAFGGIVVRDYSHKQELLKKFDVYEANDTHRGSRKYDPPTILEPEPLDNTMVLQGESMEDINKQIGGVHNEIRRGNLTGLEGLQGKAGM